LDIQKFYTSCSPRNYENLLDRPDKKKVGKYINKRVQAENGNSEIHGRTTCMNKNRGIKSSAFICLGLALFFAMAAPGWSKNNNTRTLHNYTVPDVILINQDNNKIPLKELLHSDKPIFLQFIYGTCTTICPILSIGFSHFQKKLGEGVSGVELISVSIDPDNDTPEAMKMYLKKYGAQPGWQFLSGKRDDVIQVMTAFDAYVTNKMDHYPLTFILAPGEREWVRIDGLMSTADLMNEYEKISK
jgi:protein SCO1/2